MNKGNGGIHGKLESLRDTVFYLYGNSLSIMEPPVSGAPNGADRGSWLAGGSVPSVGSLSLCALALLPASFRESAEWHGEHCVASAN
eukprot:235857-Amphidinium_carterae.1